MKGINELKRDIQGNDEIRQAFINIKDKSEAVQIAKELGYEVTEQEVNLDDELNEDILEAVSGGKGNTTIQQDYILAADKDVYENVVIDESTGQILDVKLKEK
ncbi:MAG: Nif11-like leader peptide family RiPP precursor [Clostridia bacterium]|nr:Nif11-like leader peptide family RiPP precursor [Clostridia bacterium]